MLDCARDLPLTDSLSVADSALRHRDLRRTELIHAVSSLGGPGAKRAQRVVRLADGSAANPVESALRAVALEAGLDVVPQQRIELTTLTVYPDLVDRSRRLVIEADSWRHHASRQGHARDCRRYNALSLDGWLVLRFTWDQLRFDEPGVRDTLRVAAERASSPGPTEHLQTATFAATAGPR